MNKKLIGFQIAEYNGKETEVKPLKEDDKYKEIVISLIKKENESIDSYFKKRLFHIEELKRLNKIVNFEVVEYDGKNTIYRDIEEGNLSSNREEIEVLDNIIEMFYYKEVQIPAIELKEYFISLDKEEINIFETSQGILNNIEHLNFVLDRYKYKY